MGASEILNQEEITIDEAVREVVKIGLRFEQQTKMAEAAKRSDMNPLVKLAARSKFDKIMSGQKPEPEKKQAWCRGKNCPRFKTMGGSCPKERCQFIEPKGSS